MTMNLTETEQHSTLSSDSEEGGSLFTDDDDSPVQDPIVWGLEDMVESELSIIGITSDDSPIPGDYE